MFNVQSIIVNPLGAWDGGSDVDAGAVNRKLGSDMGDGCSGGGLHGKDASKGDLSINVVAHLIAQREQKPVWATCAIGDEEVTFHIEGGKTETLPFADIVEQAKLYILTIGGYEKFAEWGLIRHKDE